jgi:hypothetical protein
VLEAGEGGLVVRRAYLELVYSIGSHGVQRDQDAELLGGSGISKGMCKHQSAYNGGQLACKGTIGSGAIVPGKYVSVKRSCRVVRVSWRSDWRANDWSLCSRLNIHPPLLAQPLCAGNATKQGQNEMLLDGIMSSEQFGIS